MGFIRIDEFREIHFERYAFEPAVLEEVGFNRLVDGGLVMLPGDFFGGVAVETEDVFWRDGAFFGVIGGEFLGVFGIGIKDDKGFFGEVDAGCEVPNGKEEKKDRDRVEGECFHLWTRRELTWKILISPASP